jgi:hypothetical protein
LATAAIALTWIDQPAGFISKIRCSGSIGSDDSVAVVAVKRTDGTLTYVLRDYADIANPRTACTFPDSEVELLDARHVLTHGCSADGRSCLPAVVDLPEVEYHWFDPPEHKSWLILAMAADLGSLVWQHYNQTTFENTVFLRDSRGDHALVTLPGGGGSCGGEGAPRTTAAYTRSGDHLYVLDTVGEARLIVAEGDQVRYSVAPPPTGWGELDGPAAPLWSPVSETLWFRRGSDIYAWSPDADARLLRREAPWFRATVSADGRHLAYLVRGSDAADLYVGDPARLSDAVRIGTNRSSAVFLNAEQLWYLAGASGCEGPPPMPRVYNVRTNTEAASIVQFVISVWPATETK